MPLVLTSSAFTHQGSIPQQYTCQGRDISPHLSWSGAPEGTKGFVLIMDDPDAPDPAAPKRTWVHWVLYAIPADASISTGWNRIPVDASRSRSAWCTAWKLQSGAQRWVRTCQTQSV